MWIHGEPKSIDYGYPWLIVNIYDSIVGVHNSVMDIRNLKFTIMSILKHILVIDKLDMKSSATEF